MTKDKKVNALCPSYAFSKPFTTYAKELQIAITEQKIQTEWFGFFCKSLRLAAQRDITALIPLQCFYKVLFVKIRPEFIDNIKIRIDGLRR